MISLFLSPLTEPSQFSLSHRWFLLLPLPPLSLSPVISLPSLNFSASLRLGLLVALSSPKPKLFTIAAIGASVGSAVAVCLRLEPPKPLPVALFRRSPNPSPLLAAPQAVAAVCRTLSHRRSSSRYLALRIDLH
ncbi:hypothetical protein Scep_009569 [Stephania cephalantha]|uniref:Uncharacterized protein n=1 Tax=Stephania cephalantha TaxID=152367 RepID=A0AAP0JTF1_9MAGN